MTGKQELQHDRKALNKGLDALALAKTAHDAATARLAVEGAIVRPFVGKVKVAYVPELPNVVANLKKAANNGTYDGGALGDDFVAALEKAAAKSGIDSASIPQFVQDRIKKLVV